MLRFVPMETDASRGGRALPISGIPVVLVGTTAFCAVYIHFAFYRLHALRIGQDTGTYLQALVNFVHTGSTYNYGEYLPKIFRHDSWTVFLALAPFIAIHPRVETLLIAVVVLVALAAIPLYLLARECGLSRPAATALACAYLISPSTQGFAFGNFTELHFIPLLAFSLALAAKRRSFLWTLVCAELLTGVKEDESLFLIWFGVAGAIWYDRRLGAGVALIGLVNWIGYTELQRIWGYAPHNPAYGLSDPYLLQHAAFLIEVLAPFAFLPLSLGQRLLLGAPLVAEVTLNQPWLGQQLAFGGSFYTVPLVTLIAIGAVFAAAERPTLVRYVVPCAIVMALFFNPTILRFGRHEYPPDWTDYCLAEAAAADGRPHVFGLDKEGVFAIAAANPNVRLVQTPAPPRPPWWWSGSRPPFAATARRTFSGCRT